MDPFDHFLQAQEPVYEQVLTELRGKQKKSHWMWFIFPQIAGLGSSNMSQRFALKSLQEAQAFLDHPVLGSRLRECTQLVIDIRMKSLWQIFGSPDDSKFHSCMTLFATASNEAVFETALNKFFIRGRRDPMTQAILRLGPRTTQEGV